jgi:hypothetical protein
MRSEVRETLDAAQQAEGGILTYQFMATSATMRIEYSN